MRNGHGVLGYGTMHLPHFLKQKKVRVVSLSCCLCVCECSDCVIPFVYIHLCIYI